MAIASPEALRDEIYSQLCKQTTNNPNEESETRGWCLISLCTGSFPPSAAFLPYLQHYIRDVVENRSSSAIKAHAYDAQRNIRGVLITGARVNPPTDLEIAGFERRRPGTCAKAIKLLTLL
jgi:hypothetical protein